MNGILFLSLLLYLPESLRLLCSKLFVGTKTEKKELRIAAIGQSIIQAIRPRAIIAPMQIGLGIQMHHHFQSKYLIDSLNALGYSSSYEEVLRFERNASYDKWSSIRKLHRRKK